MDESCALDVYMTAVREEVCSHCIERLPGAPPCDAQGKTCGIEVHLPRLIEICHTTESCLIDPYVEKFHEEICVTCENQWSKDCPCPMKYLLPLVVKAIEGVDRRCNALCDGSELE